MTDVSVRNLSRRYGNFLALDDVSFEVQSGEFLTLLGPSGCGKSTTLSALAGLDRPTSGRIEIRGRTMFDGAKGLFVDAQFRNLGLMFQSYALWPHMTVFKNLDFALEIRRIRGRAARERIEEALAMVDMDAYTERYPGELSGGQQQRVALARTLVYRPEVLLLDEPLSNLDAKLREKARLWLGELQRRTGVTTVYVTHDQAEALSLSDRIVVMNGGKIAQIGTPSEIYDKAADPFVADFVGASNLIPGRLTAGAIELAEGNKLAVNGAAAGVPAGPVTVSVRPESLSLRPEPAANAVPYVLIGRSYLGSRSLAVVEVSGQQLRVEVLPHAEVPERGFVHVPDHAMRVFAAGSEAEPKPTSPKEQS